MEISQNSKSAWTARSRTFLGSNPNNFILCLNIVISKYRLANPSKSFTEWKSGDFILCILWPFCQEIGPPWSSRQRWERTQKIAAYPFWIGARNPYNSNSIVLCFAKIDSGIICCNHECLNHFLKIDFESMDSRFCGHIEIHHDQTSYQWSHCLYFWPFARFL